MAYKIISGVEFWHGTEFGKALVKVLPPQLTRVIIDIPVDGLVKIYYASVDTGPILDLKWEDVIERFEVVEPKKIIPKENEPISEKDFETAVKTIMSMCTDTLMGGLKREVFISNLELYHRILKKGGN